MIGARGSVIGDKRGRRMIGLVEFFEVSQMIEIGVGVERRGGEERRPDSHARGYRFSTIKSCGS